MKNYIERIMDLTKNLFNTKKEIETISYNDPDMSNLMSLPGIGPFSAALIKTEIIDISRFTTFNLYCWVYCFTDMPLEYEAAGSYQRSV